MTEQQQTTFQFFFLLLISALLVAALVLDRWYAVFPLLAMLIWMIRRWLPTHSDHCPYCRRLQRLLPPPRSKELGSPCQGIARIHPGYPNAPCGGPGNGGRGEGGFGNGGLGGGN